MKNFSFHLFSITICCLFCLTLSHSIAFNKLGNCRLGEKVDGLADLKKHLNYLGYIPNLPTKLTDHFDDELNSALKTYQNNFNLKVTGALDDQTIGHLARPRCGNPDIVNGKTIMGCHYSFFNGTPVWSKNHHDLTFAFLPANNIPDQMKVASAFQKWSAVIPVTFTEVTLYDSADIKIGFFVGNHGDATPFDGVGGATAHALQPPLGIFHLDNAESWFIGDDITKSSMEFAVDLESVVVHEIGHLLGLAHSSVKESIMYPTLDFRTKKVDLVEDDIEGIQTLYGANPSYSDTTTSSAPSTRATPRGVVGLVLAVELLLL